MATAETPTQAPAGPKRLSLAEYDEMIRDGRFVGDDKFELLDGLLVKKMTKGIRHDDIGHRLYSMLLRSLPPGWHCRHESPIDLPGVLNKERPAVPSRT